MQYGEDISENEFVGVGEDKENITPNLDQSEQEIEQEGDYAVVEQETDYAVVRTPLRIIPPPTIPNVGGRRSRSTRSRIHMSPNELSGVYYSGSTSPFSFSPRLTSSPNVPPPTLTREREVFLREYSQKKWEIMPESKCELGLSFMTDIQAGTFEDEDGGVGVGVKLIDTYRFALDPTTNAGLYLTQVQWNILWSSRVAIDGIVGLIENGGEVLYTQNLGNGVYIKIESNWRSYPPIQIGYFSKRSGTSGDLQIDFVPPFLISTIEWSALMTNGDIINLRIQRLME